MGLSFSDNVIVVEHAKDGDEQAARHLCEQLKDFTQHFATKYESYAIVHDARHLDRASEDYARIFASCMKEILRSNTDSIHQFALIPQVMNRVMARLATTISGMNMTICKSLDQCHDALRKAGFELQLAA